MTDAAANLNAAASAAAQSDASQAAAATAPTPCAHCGLDVPRGLLVAAAEQQFCCHGCETAYSIIHGAGMEAYYRVRASASDTAAEPALGTGQGFAEFDDATFQERYCRSAGPERLRIDLYLENVHCAACVWLVEKLPQVLPGVDEARLNLPQGRVALTYRPGAVDLSRVARTLDGLGYPPHPARGSEASALRLRERRRALANLGIAGVCAGNAMLIAVALYAGMFSGMEAAYEQLFRWTSCVIGLVALAWPGRVFFRGAWAAWRTRTVNLDLPIALGLGVGGIAGLVNTVRGTGDIYFDSLCVLVFFLLIGRWIQRGQQRRAENALELLFSLTPTSARRVAADGTVETVAIQSLQLGDLVETLPGDSIPVDGTVESGSSELDTALLTGESRPTPVQPGDRVHAGTVNLASPLRLRVQEAGEQTRVGRLMSLVADASSRKAPLVQLADRIAGWFVAVVVVLAAGTLGVWLWLDPSLAVDHTAALLIVACPCALGLATPLALAVALGRAARRGILVKGGDALEQLAKPGRLWLDKTGTLTSGRIALQEWHGDDAARPLVAALEARATHPVARAFQAAWSALPGANTAAQDVAQDAGGGIAGSVGGHSVQVGSPAWNAAIGLTIPADLAAALQRLTTAGRTPVVVAVDGSVRGVAGLGDSLRPDAAAAIADLRAAGWQVGILSGDHPEVVQRIARELGIAPADAFGGVTPEGKLAQVRASLTDGPVAMVGDGVNDAAALAAATVGIAVHGGAEASLAAADVYLSRPGLGGIVALTGAAKRTVRTIRWSLAASLCYNLVAVSLAATGVLTPLVAAILMPLSSFTVLSLALAARTFAADAPRPPASTIPAAPASALAAPTGVSP